MTKGERLERVWSIVTDPKRSIRSIQLLAAEHGFDDLTEFNKLFHKRYGASAPELRKAVRKGRVRLGSRRY